MDETSVAEAPSEPPKAKASPASFPEPLTTVSREAVKALSMAGMSDNAILERFPDLQGATLRKWRERDPVWKTIFEKTRGGFQQRTVTRTVTKADSEALKTVTSDAVTANLVEIHAKTAISLAEASAKVLGKFAAKPAPVRSWQDASVAYKVQRLATGVDREGTEVKVNLAMFSGEAAPEQGPVWEVEDSGEAVEA